jgi:hypothetical protein
MSVNEDPAAVPERIGTIVLPAYNESDMLATSLRRIVEVLRTAMADRRWEVLVVDDGSVDNTAAIALTAAVELSTPRVGVRVLRHIANRGLGGALQTGFAHSTGDVVVVVDCDLSYHPDHIPQLVREVEDGKAQIAVASPYMPGGRTIGVPPALERRSRMANRFLATLSRTDLHTFTGMVRAYDGPFIRELALKATDDVINIETLHKTGLLHGRIVEVPAVLDWTGLDTRAGRSRMRDKRTRAKTYETVARGIMYRPYLVFSLGGMLLMLAGAVTGFAALMLPGTQVGLTVLGVSMMVAGFTAGLSSVISMQVKRGFEELFYQLSAARRMVRTVSEDGPQTGVFPLSGTVSLTADVPAAVVPDAVAGVGPDVAVPDQPVPDPVSATARKIW